MILRTETIIKNFVHLHAVRRCHQANMVSSGNCTEDRRLLLVIGKTLAGKVGASTLRNLDDDGRLDVADMLIR